MEERISYYNGDFVPYSQCVIHVGHRGFLRGDTVFDVARTFGGKPHRVREHLDRLFRSLTYARIDPGMTIDEMEDITLDVVKRNERLREPGGDYLIWQTITRGWADTFASITEDAPPNMCISVLPIDFTHHASQYDTGGHRRRPTHPELRAPVPRSQDQALQPDELLVSRAGDGRRGPGGPRRVAGYRRQHRGEYVC